MTAPRSAFYDCKVKHRRLWPKQHGFTYRLFFFALDLAELPETARRITGFTHNRRGLYEFRESDHLPDIPGETLRDRLRHWLQSQEHALTDDARVLFVTMPRILGYVFNPVSFYFISSAEGTPRGCVVQVGNTFGEMKPYLLRELSADGFYRLRQPKHFYVSPFSDLEVSFDFKIKPPTERLEVYIKDVDAEKTHLVSSLHGDRRAMTGWRLCWLTLKCPLVTLKVISMIHWEAFRLWVKRLPLHRKSAHPELQKNVLRPHASLTPK